MDTNTPTLTDQEKDYLEKYDNENPFLKSLSDFYKQRATLSEKQILALRKETQKDKTKFSRCEVLHLTINQECIFQDKHYKENKKVKINVISDKAIQVLDEENNIYAWMPKSGVEVEIEIDSNTGDETSVIRLKSWFTRDDDFWKQNKPFIPAQTKESQIQDATELIEDVMQESDIEVLNIGDPRIPVFDIDYGVGCPQENIGLVDNEPNKTEHDEQVDELNNEDDELPF